MFAFLIRRIIQAALVMLVVASIAFLMFRFLGDPISNLLPEDATVQDRAEMREKLGLNDPVLVQYGRFIVDAAQGDFGQSYRNNRPVSDLLAERFPATAELVLVAASLALALGIPLGIYTALNPRGLLSQGLQVISLLGIY